jgi:hypothetical protein
METYVFFTYISDVHNRVGGESGGQGPICEGRTSAANAAPLGHAAQGRSGSLDASHVRVIQRVGGWL